MEWHQEKRFCRICGDKIKVHKRKVHASKLSAEVNKFSKFLFCSIDLVSIQVFLCEMLSYLWKEYLESKIKTASHGIHMVTNVLFANPT